MAATAPVTGTGSAAPSGNWTLGGTYTMVFTCTSGCSGSYPHSMTVTSMDTATGAFAGAGYAVSDPSISWTISGTITGTQVSYVTLYNGVNSGYSVVGSGTISAAGTLSGTATAPGQAFSWSATTGVATWVAAAPKTPTTKDQCREDGFRNFAAAYRNQGSCVSFVARNGHGNANAALTATGNAREKKDERDAAKTAADQEASERAAAAKQKAEQDKAEQDKAEQDKAEQEKAEQEKADKKAQDEAAQRGGPNHPATTPRRPAPRHAIPAPKKTKTHAVVQSKVHGKPVKKPRR
jgi:hypothetical protein